MNKKKLRFQKRHGRDLKRADEIASALESLLSCGDDVSWEWPTTAKKGWNSRAIGSKHFRRLRPHFPCMPCDEGVDSGHNMPRAFCLSKDDVPVTQTTYIVEDKLPGIIVLSQGHGQGCNQIHHCLLETARRSGWHITWQRPLGAKDEIHAIDNMMTGGSIGYEEYTNHQWQQEARQQDPQVFALT